MSNLSLDQNLAFDTEMTLTAPWTGIPQFLGTLQNKPVIMLLKNLSTVPVFFSDNGTTTEGTTMIAGEEIVLDCRANNGTASNMGFGIGTSFFITGTAGAGSFKVSILYAK
jgi:hypothetical protein